MKRLLPGLLLVAFLPVVASAANGLSTEQRLEKLERRVGKVTELTLKLDSMQRDNRELRGQIETLEHQVEQLKRKQRDIYLDIDQRLSGMGQAPAAPAAAAASAGKPPADGGAAPVTDLTRPKTPAPTVAAASAPRPAASYDVQQMQSDYKAAYALLSPSQRRYDDAAKAFTAFLEKYPGSTLAPNAQYWQAEAYYVSQKNEQALEAFNKVVSDFPTSPKVPGALYKIGRLQHVKGNNSAARKALDRLLKDFPNSPAAGLAKDLLKKIG